MTDKFLNYLDAVLLVIFIISVALMLSTLLPVLSSHRELKAELCARPGGTSEFDASCKVAGLK